jgi:hypothetical protein
MRRLHNFQQKCPHGVRNPVTLEATSMERLGDKLKQIEATMAAERAQQNEAEKAAAAEAERLRHEGVREEFETWKRDIAQAIDRGEVPRPLRVATAPVPPGQPAFLLSAPESPDHDLFEEFERWATGEGLSIRVSHADGRGGGGALLTVLSK